MTPIIMPAVAAEKFDDVVPKPRLCDSGNGAEEILDRARKAMTLAAVFDPAMRPCEMPLLTRDEALQVHHMTSQSPQLFDPELQLFGVSVARGLGMVFLVDHHRCRAFEIRYLDRGDLLELEREMKCLVENNTRDRVEVKRQELSCGHSIDIDTGQIPRCAKGYVVAQGCEVALVALSTQKVVVEDDMSRAT